MMFAYGIRGCSDYVLVNGDVRLDSFPLAQPWAMPDKAYLRYALSKIWPLEDRSHSERDRRRYSRDRASALYASMEQWFCGLAQTSVDKAHVLEIMGMKATKDSMQRVNVRCYSWLVGCYALETRGMNE
jgi:hypothetical protein